MDIGIMNFIAGQEWIFIIIIAVVLIFGAKKIPELAKTFGKAKFSIIYAQKSCEDFPLKLALIFFSV